MKKILFSVSAMALSLTLTSCGLGTTGSSLVSGLLGGNTGSTASSVVSGLGSALTNQNTLGNLLSTFLGTTAVSESTLYGTWTYQGVDVAFESDNLLSKAGGAVAAGTIENKIDEQLSKYGIKKGSSKFTFNQDKTFSATLSGKTINGTYTYDSSSRKINLVAALGLFNQTATVGTTANGISLLFEADKMLKLVGTASSLLGNSNTTLSTLSSLVNNYNGMQIGLGLAK